MQLYNGKRIQTGVSISSRRCRLLLSVFMTYYFLLVPISETNMTCGLEFINVSRIKTCKLHCWHYWKMLQVLCGKKNLAAAQKFKRTVAMWLSNSNSSYIAKRKAIHVCKDLWTSVIRSRICKIQHLKWHGCPYKWHVNKQDSVYSYSEILFGNKK